MGLIQASFSKNCQIYNTAVESDLTLQVDNRYVGEDGVIYWRDNGRNNMYTFKQVTEIEHIRRQIEALQYDLSEQLSVKSFATATTERPTRDTSWTTQTADLVPALREALCKHTIGKILRLLDEAKNLDVDTTDSRAALAAVLKELSSPQEAPP